MTRLLTLNAGSSSIKWAIFEGGFRTDSGSVDRLGEGGGSHAEALAGIISRTGASIGGVGHRIVHGGTYFDTPTLIDDAVLARIESLVPLAPLHQPHNLAGVHAARRAFAGISQVACFDTAFHRSQPELNQRFALPESLHTSGVQRYGFHGISYESIRDQFRALQPELAGKRVVVAHLGNGASLCAMREGKSVATTMTFSPLDGLPMGTRCGGLDPAVVLHLLRRGDLDVDDVERILVRESGLLGLSGESRDMRELEASSAAPARLAIDYFVEHVLRQLAAMAAALRGLDALVFTGGIGENSVQLRARILDGAAWMGFALDEGANAQGANAPCISARGSKVSAWVLRTDEEAVIARHTGRLARSRTQ